MNLVTNWQDYHPYFRESEFHCKHIHPHGSKECETRVSLDLGDKLFEARGLAGARLERVRFILNSACRCALWNSHVGGEAGSSHCTERADRPLCEAVDIRKMDPEADFWIVWGLIHAGFQRILDEPGWFHADVNPPRRTAFKRY